MLGIVVEPWLESKKRKAIQTAKFYFFDTGVCNYILGTRQLDRNSNLWVDETGKEAVLCNRGDGLGLDMLKKTGLPILVLSKEKNPVVTARCKKLELECIQGINDKLSTLKEWAQTKKLALADLAYLGNDVNDLECLKAVGLPVGVADSHPSILPACRLVLASNGGFGAVRELCDLILTVCR